MRDTSGMTGPPRDRIFDAVLEELANAGIDAFTIDGVARRAGVDPSVISACWRDRRVLLMDAMLARAGQHAPVPETGSLRDDMAALSSSLMQLSDTELGRQWFHRLLPSGRDADLSQIGADFWAFQMRSVESMFRRAAERGELRAGVDPGEAAHMLAAALYYDVIFHDSPVRPEYAAHVGEIFLYGILALPTQHAVLIEDLENREHMRTLLRTTTDAMIDPVALLEAVRDDDGRIIDFAFREVNPAACTYLQRCREDLLGSSMTETLPDIESSGMLTRYVRCLETGKPVTVDDFEYFSQRHQQVRRYDLRGARAGPDWLSMTWRDVTDPYRHHPYSSPPESG